MHALRRAVCWCMGVYLTYHALLLQVKHKFNGLMANIFKETFCWLPLGHVLNRRVLVVHGGLFSRDGVKLDDIRAINRYRCGLTLSSPQAGPEDSSDRASGARVPGMHIINVSLVLAASCNSRQVPRNVAATQRRTQCERAAVVRLTAVMHFC